MFFFFFYYQKQYYNFFFKNIRYFNFFFFFNSFEIKNIKEWFIFILQLKKKFFTTKPRFKFSTKKIHLFGKYLRKTNIINFVFHHYIFTFFKITFKKIINIFLYKFLFFIKFYINILISEFICRLYYLFIYFNFTIIKLKQFFIKYIFKLKRRRRRRRRRKRFRRRFRRRFLRFFRRKRKSLRQLIFFSQSYKFVQLSTPLTKKKLIFKLYIHLYVWLYRKLKFFLKRRERKKKKFLNVFFKFKFKKKFFKFLKLQKLLKLIFKKNIKILNFLPNYSPNSSFFLNTYYPTTFKTFFNLKLFFIQKKSIKHNFSNFVFMFILNFFENFFKNKIFVCFKSFKKKRFPFAFRKYLKKLIKYQYKIGPRLMLSEMYYIIWLAFKIKDIFFLTLWIKRSMERIRWRKQKVFLLALRFILRRCITPFSRYLRYYGYRCVIWGKIGVSGNSKTRNFVCKNKVHGLTTKTHKTSYEFTTINTFTGVLGVSFYLVF